MPDRAGWTDAAGSGERPGPGRSGSTANIAATLAGIALVVYVLFLLLSNFRSERNLQRQLLFQFRQETAVRAMSLRHVIASATDGVATLSGSRLLHAFYDGREAGAAGDADPGRALLPLRERFLDIARRGFGDGESLFSRIVLVDGRGTLLVDTSELQATGAPWTPYVGPFFRQSGAVAAGEGGAIVISHPSYFKGRYEGQIVAWLNEKALVNLLLEEGEQSHLLFVATPDGTLVQVAAAPAARRPPTMPGIDRIPPGVPREFAERTEDGGERRMVACRHPVEGTPLSVIQVAEASSLLGRLTPFEQLARMSVVALALLLGTLQIERLHVKSLVLKEKLEVSVLREREIQRKNEELEVEVAERKRAQEAHARLSMAVEQAGEAIVITDPEGTIQYVNPAFERVTGFSREEAIGKTPRIVRSGRHDEAFYGSLWGTLGRGESWTGTFVNRRKDGTLFEEAAVISPVRDASGTVVNYVAVKRDVTREVQIEEHFRQTQRLEAIGKLAGGIAHDFNNLLTAINGYCEILLKRTDIGPPARTEVQEIAKAGRHAAALTRQLLAFGRKQMLQPRVLDLNAVTANMERLLRRLIGENVDLIRVAGGDLWTVKVDPGQLEQVIMNLVVNAWDAMPQGGKIIIETRNVRLDGSYVATRPVVKPGAYVMLAVSDTGMGMDEETRARVFEPFFTTKEQGKGTGLGLSTVYGIVKQSQGYVWAYSEAGRGATFKVYLPRASGMAEESSAPESRPGGVRGGSETVLLAEDEELVRELAEAVLRNSGYKVLCARDGEEALSIASSWPETIHLLVTDVVMPGMGGKELAGRIAGIRPGVRTLFMSGYTENAIVRQGILDPDADFLPKPFPIEALARKVREVLDRPCGSPAA